MFALIFRTIFGTKHERDVKRMRPAVAAINALEPAVQALSDAELRAKTDEFRKRLADGEELDGLLHEAFAACREAARRTVRMRHFDVQLMGGMVLHEGKIAEMATGEGKTLVATLPAYLNALPGLGTHVITVNDYLARRDAQWMGPIYHALGLSVGVIQHEVQYLYDPTYASPDIRLAGLRPCTRREAYHADITYGTNNEFGFDYLRDNMRFSLEDMVQREHHYAIVDEVDSILIDEARTPLIISGRDESAENKAPLYERVDRIIPKLKRAATIVEGKLSEIEEQAEGDFIVDEKAKTVSLTEQGVSHCERLLGVDNLSDPANMEIAHLVHQSLKAHHIFAKDVDYVVKDMETVDDAGRLVVQPQVIIVDEFTGRLMPGRRWSDGLHEAVEAKEGIRIAKENQTLATITLQNYFRMYDKLAGMTGTAATEAEEFGKIYKLDVTVIPTNQTLIRHNHPDVVYKTEREKFDAVTKEIAECNAKGQPVLVGTVSIEKSERLSKLLKRQGIPHQVLNAKYHEREAEIVAQAGREGTVTIATNMAGRGTDILLGGNPDFMAKAILSKKGLDPATAPAAAREGALAEARKITDPEHERVVALGGLHIIGTERHESRRIDNQLRGRSGRQGDPGSSRFYLSLEDDLLRIFGSERIQRIMDRLGMEEGEPIEHKLVTRAISTAQKRVETRNFEIRKHLLEYDDVMNKQREIVYGLRRQCLEDESQEETVLEWMAELADATVERYAAAAAHPEDWDLKGLSEALYRQFDFRLPPDVTVDELPSHEALLDLVRSAAERNYREREEALGSELFHRLERWIMLGLEWEGGGFRGINQLWREHLLNMDHLKEGIGLRGYGQRDPLVEYKKEAFEIFQEMIEHLKEVVVEQLFKVRASREEPLPQRTAVAMAPPRWQEGRGGSEPGAPVRTPSRAEPRTASGQKVGRNDPCPCGSGKKYKKCCLLKSA
ncbi:MAG TPA: preprotein translocase subunit SecA [Methylomirabilota bacterium]|jgi:preprotein translocase subunit SecA|nr:preprotein translocase subunit SecA [Methylomirabilota bacterium]